MLAFQKPNCILASLTMAQRPYAVQPGDTVVDIAQTLGTLSSNVVTQEGQLPDPFKLFAGQQLAIRLERPANQTTMLPCHIHVQSDRVARSQCCDERHSISYRVSAAELLLGGMCEVADYSKTQRFLSRPCFCGYKRLITHCAACCRRGTWVCICRLAV